MAGHAASAAARVARALGSEWPWIPPLALRFERRFGSSVPPRMVDVVEFLRGDEGFALALARYGRRIVVVEPHMGPAAAGAFRWPVPHIQTAGELGQWLGLAPTELEWFADLRGLGRTRDRQPLAHYRYQTLVKRSGRLRLIEAPKPRLKGVQRHILDEIIGAIPVDEAVHGFVRGRSIATFAAPHVGKAMVVRMDLRDFFPSIRAARVESLFRTMGYAEPVADLLAGLVTNEAPAGVWRDIAAQDPTICENPELIRRAHRLYCRPHLPQGAPTSPAVANLCFHRADRRLHALADASGATYTRYADDIAFSGDGDFARSARRFTLHAAAIIREEGFSVEHRKTRIMPAGGRQRLAGIIVNAALNIPRADYEQLEAILTNCVRRGPSSQNREADPLFEDRLRGRVAFLAMLNPQKAERLERLIRRVDWESG